MGARLTFFQYAPTTFCCLEFLFELRGTQPIERLYAILFFTAKIHISRPSRELFGRHFHIGSAPCVCTYPTHIYAHPHSHRRRDSVILIILTYAIFSPRLNGFFHFHTLGRETSPIIVSKPCGIYVGCGNVRAWGIQRGTVSACTPPIGTHVRWLATPIPRYTWY